MAKRAFTKNATTANESGEVTKKLFTKHTPIGEESRRKIFEGAFRLFLTKPYELVTVADLEQITGKSRGAIFYHLKDMRELFEIVVEKYIVDIQNISKLLSAKNISIEGITLLEFIGIYISAQEENVNKMYGIARVDRNSDTKTVSEGIYLSFLLNAGYYIDDYNEKMSSNFKMDRNTWSFVIQNAIEKGEVKPGTDATLFGDIFLSILYGQAFMKSFEQGINAKEVKELFMRVYNGIKV